MTDPIQVRRQKDQIWSHVRSKWLLETPEEAVRQEYRPESIRLSLSSGGLGRRLKFVFCTAAAGRAGGQDAGIEQELDVAQGGIE